MGTRDTGSIVYIEVADIWSWGHGLTEGGLRVLRTLGPNDTSVLLRG